MPLSRFRVVQIGTGIALDYCGKLFADFGADVVKLEPVSGDPLRGFPPLLDSGESGTFAWLNTNKRSVTETPLALETLLTGADLLLDGRPLTHGHPPEATQHPRVATTTLTWFGANGPMPDTPPPRPRSARLAVWLH